MLGRAWGRLKENHEASSLSVQQEQDESSVQGHSQLKQSDCAQGQWLAAHAKEVHDVWESMPHHTKQILTCLWLIQMPRRLKGVERIRGLETSRSSSPRGKIQNRDQKQQLFIRPRSSELRQTQLVQARPLVSWKGRDSRSLFYLSVFTYLCVSVCMHACACTWFVLTYVYYTCAYLHVWQHIGVQMQGMYVHTSACMHIWGSHELMSGVFLHDVHLTYGCRIRPWTLSLSI